MLSKSVHRNRPHHWCSPPAQDVLTLRTICAKYQHEMCWMLKVLLGMVE